ncbi:MAG: Oxidoreductase, short chain dehydrogenase/reductase family, partial [uncultured Acetobacteraceae bacterium]
AQQDRRRHRRRLRRRPRRDARPPRRRLDRRARGPPRRSAQRDDRDGAGRRTALPGRPDRRGRSPSRRGAVRGRAREVRSARFPVQQRRRQRARHAAGGPRLRGLDARGAGEPDRLLPLRPAGLPHDEGAAAAGRAHRQQRLHLGARAAARLRPLHFHQARDHRPDEVAVPGRAQVRHLLRPARHRQRRHADDPADATRRQAGERHDRGRADHGRRARREHHRHDGEPSARREHPNGHRDGDEDAVHRPRL